MLMMNLTHGSRLIETIVVFECPCGVVSSPHSLRLIETIVVFELCGENIFACGYRLIETIVVFEWWVSFFSALPVC